MPITVWLVVGGAKTGGIVVREGQDTSSPEAAERLATGAFVKELEYVADSARLRYEKLEGAGPDQGWVSTKFKSTDLLVRGPFWEVVGGADKGGVLVRQGEDTNSPQAAERLSTGAIVKQVDFIEESTRLQYEILTGSGPPTGWVSTKLKSANLLVRVPNQSGGPSGSTSRPRPAPAAPKAQPKAAAASGGESGGPVAAPAPPTGQELDIRMFNEEKGFSYEKFPSWVPRVAAVARLWREKKPYLPTPAQPLERSRNIQFPPPFIKLPPKKLKEMFKQNLPGCMFGMPFPQTAEQMISAQFGPEWFTKAFHATGTLPKDNRVTKVLRAEELPIDGFKKEGGAAMKCFITVEYEKPDPELHTELFAKYTYDPARDIPGQITLGQDDSPEVFIAIHCQHLFPHPAAKFYYADVCRENTAFLIITETIPYGKRGGHAFGPYEILPGCGKCQDFLLEAPLDHYCALFRSMGQMAAWDKQGRFDLVFGKQPQWAEADYLASVKRPPQPRQSVDVTRSVVTNTADKVIDFLMNWCPKMAPSYVRDEAVLQKAKREIVEMSPYFKDMSDTYQASCSDYVAAVHVNLQADNAWFWRDEYGDMHCGVLDWGGFYRGNFCVRWLGCLSGADTELLLGHVEGVIECFRDEYVRCGGPRLDTQELLLRWQLAQITYMFDCFSYVERHTYKETPKDEFLAFSGPQDPVFQERFYTRCGCLPTINTWHYYVKKGDLKAIFDKWASGKGKPFLTVYE